MIEYLVGHGQTEAASTVAGIFSEHVDSKLKFMASTVTSSVNSVCNHFVEVRAINVLFGGWGISLSVKSGEGCTIELETSSFASVGPEYMYLP